MHCRGDPRGGVGSKGPVWGAGRVLVGRVLVGLYWYHNTVSLSVRAVSS